MMREMLLLSSNFSYSLSLQRICFIILLLLTVSCDGAENDSIHLGLPSNNSIHQMHQENSLTVHNYHDPLMVATTKTLTEHDPSRLLQQNCVYNENDLNTAMSSNLTQINLCSSYITINSNISAVSKNIKVTCNLKLANGVKCMLDAQGLSRHFYASNATLYFYDIVFINGFTLDHGGAIYMTTCSKVTMYRCDFINNIVGSTDMKGGAIYSYNSILDVTQSNFINNSANFVAGGIYSNNSTITITGNKKSVIENNTANFGGFMASDDSTIMITNYLFRNNVAKMYGGGIYASDSIITMTGRSNNSVVANNKASYGGFIIAFDSNIKITNYLFRNNVAENDGGGIYSDASIVTMTGNNNSVVENNTASNGGFMRSYHSNVMITNFLFRNNGAINRGGVIVSDNSTVDLIQNNFINNFANYVAGGISFNHCAVTIVGSYNSVIENNTAPFAGFMAADNSNIMITNYSFRNNVAKNSGGGIYSADSIVTMIGDNHSVVENNKASYGGFMIAFRSIIIITKYLFRNNVAPGRGGAIYSDNTRLTLSQNSSYENVVFQNNSANQGGALFLYGLSLSLTNVVFENNKANDGTIRSHNSDLALKNDSFLSSDPDKDPCNLYVSQAGSNYSDDPGDLGRVIDPSYRESCINLPKAPSINNRRLQTKRSEADSQEHSAIFDPDYQMDSSIHRLWTTNTPSVTHVSLPNNSTPKRMMLSSTCVSSSAALKNAVLSANPQSSGTSTKIRVCTARIPLGSLARRLQSGNSSVLTNILDGIDISNKNIVFECARRPRRKAQCTLDAGGIMRHFYGSNTKVEFHNIRFINGYHLGAGGAFSINNADVKLKTCSFENNTAQSGAGAVLVNQSRLIVGRKTSITQSGGNGAPFEIYSSNATVQDVTVADNNASQFGDSVIVFNSTFNVANAIFGNMTDDCNLFVSVDPLNRTRNGTCVSL